MFLHVNTELYLFPPIVPEITISTDFIEVEAGESFSITCTSSFSARDVDFSWRYPGQFSELNAQNVDIVDASDGSLTVITVFGATLQNNGNYTCNLREMGEVTLESATATVDIIHREL